MYIIFIKKRRRVDVSIQRRGFIIYLILQFKSISNIFVLQDQSQHCGDITFHAFDPVIVRLSLDSNNIQHEKFVLQLVKPYIENFSVLPLNEDEDDENERVVSEPEKKVRQVKKLKKPK